MSVEKGWGKSMQGLAHPWPVCWGGGVGLVLTWSMSREGSRTSKLLSANTLAEEKKLPQLQTTKGGQQILSLFDGLFGVFCASGECYIS